MRCKDTVVRDDYFTFVRLDLRKGKEEYQIMGGDQSGRSNLGKKLPKGGEESSSRGHKVDCSVSTHASSSSELLLKYAS